MARKNSDSLYLMWLLPKPLFWKTGLTPVFVLLSFRLVDDGQLPFRSIKLGVCGEGVARAGLRRHTASSPEPWILEAESMPI